MNIKKNLAAMFLLFAATVSYYGQAAPDVGDLTKLLNDFLTGAGQNDALVHDRFWAEDLIYTRSAGVRTNKVELMKGVREAPKAKIGDPVTVYSAADVRIQQYGDAAVVAFRLVGITTKADGTKTGSNHLNTGTFIKRNGKWQAVAWQATTVPAPEPQTVARPAPLLDSAALGAPKSDSKSSDSTRKYLKGTRGGCYYLSPGGKKVYVDHGLCN